MDEPSASSVMDRTSSSGTSTDRRHEPRVTVALSVRVYDQQGALRLQARTIDLSPSGALVHGSVTLPVGERVQLDLVRGASRNPLQLEARVVRIAEPATHRRHHGVALRFIDPSPLDQALLTRLIDRARA